MDARVLGWMSLDVMYYVYDSQYRSIHVLCVILLRFFMVGGFHSISFHCHFIPFHSILFVVECLSSETAFPAGVFHSKPRLPDTCGLSRGYFVLEERARIIAWTVMMVRRRDEGDEDKTPRNDRKPNDAVPPPRDDKDDGDDDSDDHGRAGPGREERARMNDRGRARSKSRQPRKHRSSASHGSDAHADDYADYGITKCQVCNQKVGGGEVGFKNHCRTSKHHLAYEYHNRGLPWKQAVARANKEWVRRWDDFRGRSRTVEPRPPRSNRRRSRSPRKPERAPEPRRTARSAEQGEARLRSRSTARHATTAGGARREEPT